jgi:phthalate 4,5-dioxygenase oxygenase subunit
MVTQSENERLTRVGRGTPMGDLMRQYWIPVLESSDLPVPDTRPMRVKLLGEDLVAFRNSSNQVGLVAEHCAHRRASLFYGRVEHDCLRCVYHGWQYDLSGHCVDMPNEPAESNFKQSIRISAYPCRERNGIVWAYLGPREDPPALPELEANCVPENHRFVARTLRECNWLQGLEGDIDSSHISFLHSVFDPSDFLYRDFEYRHRDKSPKFSVEATEYGAVYGARRTIDAENYHWRFAHFMLPFFTIIPPNDPSRIHLSAWVPLDDETVQLWSIVWDPFNPLPEELLRLKDRGRQLPGFEIDQYVPDGNNPNERGRLVGNRENDYLIDYEAQKTVRFSGIPTFHLQDKAMTESMGRIVDRTQEHLGRSDLMIIQVRRRLSSALKNMQADSINPPGVDNPHIYGLRSASLVLSKETDWLEGAADYLQAFTGTPIAFVV